MLRTKILIIIALCIVLLTSLLYVISTEFLLQSYEEIEKTSIERNIIRVAGTLSNEGSALNIKLRDWAQWDDTYQFMQDRNEEYLISNLADATLINLEINLMTFITPQGEVAYSKKVDLEEGVVVPHEEITQEILAYLKTEDGATALKASGVIKVREGLLLFEALPVILSDGTGTPNGTLVFGRFLDAQKIQHISDLTQLQVDLFPYQTLQEPAFSEIRNILVNNPHAIIPASDTSIEGYFTLSDIRQTPVGVIRITTAREISLQGKTTVGTFTLVASGSILLFGILILFLLETLVLRRFMNLTKQVEQINTKSLNTAHIHDAHSNDEIGKLATKVNHLLSELSFAQEKEREALSLQKKTNDELKQNLIDLENINKLMVGRELKMVELKAELDQLKNTK